MIDPPLPRAHRSTCSRAALLLFAAAAAALLVLSRPLAAPPELGTADRSVSSWLWSDGRVVELVASCETNGFVRALADGSLPRSAFAGYVAQDKFFLQAFARAYALAGNASAAVGDAASAAEFERLIAGVRQELSLHAGYAARWGVDMARVEPSPECRAYTEFLLHVAATEGVAASAAAMVPCMRLYAALGQRIAARQRRCAAREDAAPGAARCGAGAYQEWVDTYAAGDFEALAVTLEALLDRVARAAAAPPRALLRERYVRAMQLELAFFDAWAP